MEQVRAGLVIGRPSPAATVAAIQAAEAQGVPAAWSIVVGAAPDPVTTYAAAAVRTARIGLGTAIVPTYPRHPVALAAQALVLADLAPGRFRLGIGTSTKAIIEEMFGIPFTRPLGHLREYLTVLRGLLWTGAVDFQGEFFRVKTRLPPGVEPPRVPVPIAALRAPAFRLAGELADGAISWLCPVAYLVDTALPALREGAAAAGRPVPPLIGHVLVSLHDDPAAVRAAAHRQFDRYARVPFYAAMFAAAGFPVTAGVLPDALLDDLVVSGDAAAVTARLQAIRAAGVDEILVSLVPVANPAAEETAVARVLATL